MGFIINFIAVFIIIYLGYYFFIVRHIKEYNIRTCPKEILYIIKIYKLDINKINFKKFLRLVTITNSLIMALTVTVVTVIDNLYLKLILGFFLLMPLIIFGYSLIGRYYRRKGMINNV